ncbi:MAG: hypothetical protein WBF88_17100 [Pusillimonas sp.]
MKNARRMEFVLKNVLQESMAVRPGEANRHQYRTPGERNESPAARRPGGNAMIDYLLSSGMPRPCGPFFHSRSQPESEGNVRSEVD